MDDDVMRSAVVNAGALGACRTLEVIIDSIEKIAVEPAK